MFSTISPVSSAAPVPSNKRKDKGATQLYRARVSSLHAPDICGQHSDPSRTPASLEALSRLNCLNCKAHVQAWSSDRTLSFRHVSKPNTAGGQRKGRGRGVAWRPPRGGSRQGSPDRARGMDSRPSPGSRAACCAGKAGLGRRRDHFVEAVGRGLRRVGRCLGGPAA